MYIKKQIEINNSGNFTEYWIADVKSVELMFYPKISILMDGYKDEQAFLDGKERAMVIRVETTASELELSGSIGYENIPKLYELLTTKKISPMAVFLQEGQDNEVPAYPDFFGGEIIE